MCGEEICSRLALNCHMRRYHLGIKPYLCEQCDSSFNNLKEVSSHKSVVHRQAAVKCCFCDYKYMTKARMHQHVRIHSKGLRYQFCPKSFPLVGSLRKHTEKHKTSETFECEKCDCVFRSQTSMATHNKGVHGPGYCCSKCGIHLNSPAQ